MLRSFCTAELATRRFAALRSDNCGESDGRRRAGYGCCALTDALWLGVAALLAAQLQQIQGSGSASSADGGLGTRNSSAAQAPRSMRLQRSLQKGRQRLLGANRAGSPQVGQATVGGVDAGGWGAAGVVMGPGQERVFKNVNTF